MRCFTDKTKKTLFVTTLATLTAVLEAHAAVSKLPPPEIAGSANSSALNPSLVWQANIEDAVALARTQYKPVFVLFTSSYCVWCRRLKSEALSAAEVTELLQHFTLVEVDVEFDANTALKYRVQGVPSIVILTSDGEPRAGVSGYVTAAELQRTLRKALHPQFLRAKEAPYLELMKALDDNVVPSNLWAEAMIHLGTPDRRAEIKPRLLKLSPFPRRAVVDLLSDSRLAVRLGAVEVIEEVRGDDAGFDPWLDASSLESNRMALARIETWAGSQASGSDTNALFSSLTEEQVRGYVGDVLLNDGDRSARALRMLEQGGSEAVKAIASHLDAHPDIQPEARNRLKEVEYYLCIYGRGGLDASALSRRLLRGTLDARLKAMAELKRVGFSAIPILRDFLDDPDPIVRETAAETLVTAARARAFPLLRERLKLEKDRDVVIAILTSVGKSGCRPGMDILVSMLSDPNEDIVIAALQGLSALRVSTCESSVIPLLDDVRWRVRVATLETIAELKLSHLDSKVADILSDKDPFVRYTAVKTLTAISAKRATRKLEEAFLKEDELKGPIVAAYVSMDIPIPDSFINAMENKTTETIFAVLEGLRDGEARDLCLAEKFIRHPDSDVVCQAARLIAMKGMRNSNYRRIIVEFLQSGRREHLIAILDALQIENSDIPATHESAESEDETAPQRTSSEIDNILDAFGGDEIAPVEKSIPPGSDYANDNGATSNGQTSDGATSVEDALLAAFNEAGDVAPSASTSSPPDTATDANVHSVASVHGAAVLDILKAIGNLFSTSQDTEICFKAALRLAGYGDPSGVSFLERGLATRTAAERMEVAQSVFRRRSKDGLKLLTALLRDTSKDVRTAAVEACLSRDNASSFAQIVLDELARPGAVLKPHEVRPGWFESAMRESKMRRVVNNWVRGALDESKDTALQNFALALLRYCSKSGDESPARRFIHSESPWQRRAALYALGTLDRKNFTNELQWVCNDTSEFVREVIPAVYAGKTANWLDYFDQSHFDPKETSHSYSYCSHESLPRLPPAAQDVLARLTSDESPRVRTEAFFCLLANRQPVDLVQFVRTIESFPDQDVISVRVAAFLLGQYEQLGQSFQALLPYLERARYRGDNLERVRKHFRSDSDNFDALVEVMTRPGAPSVHAAFLESANAPAQKTHALKLVYFAMPGCMNCEKVERHLDRLRDDFPDMRLETHNIRKLAAMRLNEALCARFGVPERLRLIAPAVIGGGGFLVKTEITYDSLANLAARSVSVPLEDWYDVPADSIEKANAAIENRYSRMSAGMIVVAGLLDGVNPCAFATIIFLLSYLQISRLAPGQILQVGLMFVTGVFLTYFALGMGLVELVYKAQSVLRWFRDALNWTLAAFSLIIMVLNLRDGYLCLKGRLREIVLQLPDALKDGIHGVIRRGSRRKHFLVAAFVIGIVISVLELACTGQVLLPTIGFILEKGGNRRGATGYLLLYNLMFIAPLLVVFAVSFFGLSHEKLTRALRRHAAPVKFLTAALFLVLFLFFVFGDRLSGILAGIKVVN